jgi:hypothetical protein
MMTPEQLALRQSLAHDYPETASARLQRLVAAQEAAQSLMIILGRFENRIAGQLPC